MSQDATYKNIRATVRTPRCAIFINKNSDYWRTAAAGAITCSSEVWGGRHFLVIPTDGMQIGNKFWEILEAYNPDHLGVYRLSYADMEAVDPDGFAENRERQRTNWQSQGLQGGFDEWFEKQARVTPVDDWNISDDLERELIARLGPFHLDDHAISQPLSRGAGFGFPFTKISDIILLATRHVDQVTLPKPVEDSSAGLLIYSQTGLASPAYCEKLSAEGLSIDALPGNYPTIDFMEHALGRLHIMLGGASGANAWMPSQDYMPNTPFGISMLHLGSYYDSRKHLRFKEPVVVIVGDDVEDFCLYYSLSRLHEDVFWMPLAWLKDSYSAFVENGKRYRAQLPMRELDEKQRWAFRLIDLFFERAEHGRGEKRIELLSMSLNPRQLATRRRQMIDCCMVDQSSFGALIGCVPIERSSTRCILRVFEEDNYSNSEPVIFIEKDAVTPFPTPKPKNFSVIKPYGHFWVTSLQIEDYCPPPLPSLGSEIVNINGLGTESRVAADGISYHCPNVAYFGGGIDAVLVRPKIHMPDEMEMLGAYFAEIGVTIRYSDKGNYFLDTVDRFGSLEAAGEFVKTRRTRRILDNFISKATGMNGNIIYLENDQRAYLSFEAIRSSVGGKEETAALIDNLVKKQIIERGYIFQCQRCRLASWYGIDALTTEFICGRCSFKQQFGVSHWKQPVEPRWYYKLAETVYQFYFHNSHLTLQVLYKLKGESKVAFHYVPEIDLLDFPDEGKKRELDIACILDGQIVIGEGKTGKSKGEILRVKDVEKFEDIAKKHARRPDQTIFATSLPSVSREFKSRVAQMRGARVLLFSDLYGR
jgi:hypothetical protein